MHLNNLHIFLNFIEVLLCLTGLIILLFFGSKHLLRHTVILAFICLAAVSIASIYEIHFPEEEFLRIGALFILLISLSHEVVTLRKYDRFLTSELLDSIQDLVWIKDAKGRYTYVNAAVINTLFKCGKNHVLGKTDAELYKGCGEDKIEPALYVKAKESDSLVFKTKEAAKVLEVGKVGNKIIAIQVIKTPLFNKKGKYIGLIALGRDLLYDLQDHALLEKLYREKKFNDFEKLFEEHKYRYIDKPTGCV